MQVLKKLLFETENHHALDSNGDAPLHSYVRRREFDCLVTFLIYSKCDINYQNIEGQTALHLACKVSHCFFRPYLFLQWKLQYSCKTYNYVKVILDRDKSGHSSVSQH